MVTASQGVRLFTIEDLVDFPNDGQRREIIDGELIVAAAPVLDHQMVSLNVAAVVRQYVREHRWGRVYQASEVHLSPSDIVIPDVTVISDKRKSIMAHGVINGSPNIVIEIHSPSTRHIDVTRKRALFQRYGIQEYWLIDLIQRSVRILELVAEQYELVPMVGGRPVSHVLPGLVIELDDIFAETGDEE